MVRDGWVPRLYGSFVLFACAIFSIRLGFMTKSVSQRRDDADWNSAEAKRMGGIHLVTSARATPMPEAESVPTSTRQLAGAALIAPVIWMGHALVAWMERR